MDTAFLSLCHVRPCISFRLLRRGPELQLRAIRIVYPYLWNASLLHSLEPLRRCCCVGARPARFVKWSFSSLSMGTTLLFAVTLPSIGSLSPCIFNTLLYSDDWPS